MRRLHFEYHNCGYLVYMRNVCSYNGGLTHWFGNAVGHCLSCAQTTASPYTPFGSPHASDQGQYSIALAFVPSKRTWKCLCVYRSGQLAASLLHGAAQDPLLPSAGHTAALNPWLALWGAALSYISSSNSLLVNVVGHSRCARWSAGSQHCHPPTQLLNNNFYS